MKSKSVASQYIPGREQPPQKEFAINLQIADGKDLLMITKIRVPKLRVRKEWKV